MAYETINPATGERLQTFPEHTEEEVQEKLVHANSAYARWRSMSFQERAAIVEKAAGIMRERSEEFSNLSTLEMGKLIKESRGETALSADILSS